MQLEKHEVDSPLWKKLEGILRERIAKCHVDNDDLNKNEIQTAIVRGRISELKYILAFAKQPKMID